MRVQTLLPSSLAYLSPRQQHDRHGILGGQYFPSKFVLDLALSSPRFTSRRCTTGSGSSENPLTWITIHYASTQTPVCPQLPSTSCSWSFAHSGMIGKLERTIRVECSASFFFRAASSLQSWHIRLSACIFYSTLFTRMCIHGTGKLSYPPPFT